LDLDALLFASVFYLLFIRQGVTDYSNFSSAPDSLSTHILYSRKALKKRYQGLNLASLENSIGNTVKKEILKHLRECGFLSE
jgi:hypothetical protein